MLANFVVDFLNTSLFTKLLLLNFSNWGGQNHCWPPPPPRKLGGGAVPLVSTGSGPHGTYSTRTLQ